MPCNKCGKSSCGCSKKTITKQGLRGLRGPQGKAFNSADIARFNLLTTINVANTVFVMKNGNDSTGLVERFDKPFLTIAAARTAALAFFTSRTQTSRVKIIVESGNYTETITIYDFIDYDLGNSVITAPVGGHCISDNGSAYTATTSGFFTSVITGNAKFVSTNALHGGLSIMSTNSANLKLYLQCDQITSSTYEAIIMGTGYAVVYANKIYNGNAVSALYQCIDLATDDSYDVTPTLEVYNAKIYTNQSGSINSCIEFSNANPTLNTDNSKIMLVNCEVGSWSTTRPAINGDHTGTGRGQLTLKNTLIFTDGNACISDDSAPSILKVFAYSSFAKFAHSFVNVSSEFLVTDLVIDDNLLFNQGNTI